MIHHYLEELSEKYGTIPDLADLDESEKDELVKIAITDEIDRYGPDLIDFWADHQILPLYESDNGAEEVKNNLYAAVEHTLADDIDRFNEDNGIL